VNNLVYLIFLPLRELGKKLKKFSERNLFHIIIITKKYIYIIKFVERTFAKKSRKKQATNFAKGRCFTCGKYGHYADKCPKPPRKLKKKGN
jgi:hypothetical protein